MEKLLSHRTIRCQLQVLTPVHIGCDDVYEPTGFAVDEERNRLVVFDPTDFIQALEPSDREHFSSICTKGTIESILEIYKFLRNRAVNGRSVGLCNGFVDHYRQVLAVSPKQARQQLNRFEIRRTAFSPVDNRPYIPGSAVKGALRTGYLNALALKGPDYRHALKKAQQGRYDNRHKVLESKLLLLEQEQPKDRISKDPFRMVKVSDFMPVGKAETKVMYAVNWKKSPSGGEGRGPYQILEVILPGAIFVGEIRVEKPQSKDAVSMSLTLKDLLEGCRGFFLKEARREDRDLSGMGCKRPFASGNNGGLPFRVGYHSGAECVTVEGYRDIRIMGKNKTWFSDHATTAWLASEVDKPKHPDFLLPFGWTAMTTLQSEDARDLSAQERSFKQERDQALQEAADAAREILEKEKEEAERLERIREQEAAEKAAEEERLAALEAMSSEERAIAELKSGNIVENRAVEIYAALQDYDAPYKKQAAQALMDFWKAQGKWSGKQSKKQKEKIQKIRGILGE